MLSGSGYFSSCGWGGSDRDEGCVIGGGDCSFEELSERRALERSSSSMVVSSCEMGISGESGDLEGADCSVPTLLSSPLR